MKKKMPHILIVDHDVAFTQQLHQQLTKAHFQVHCVHNDADAITMLRQRSFDLLLLEQLLPMQSGLEMLKQIRQHFSLPILIMNAKNDELDRILALELGADGYITKPFSARELLAHLHALLRRTMLRGALNHTLRNEAQTAQQADAENALSLSQSLLVFEEVTLQIGRQQAFYQGTDLNLTGTEFALLYLLIRHAGDVLTREQLSLHVLGKPLTLFDRAIDMHVSNLRKKLPPRALPWIKTLRGRGYLLITA